MNCERAPDLVLTEERPASSARTPSHEAVLRRDPARAPAQAIHGARAHRRSVRKPEPRADPHCRAGGRRAGAGEARGFRSGADPGRARRPLRRLPGGGLRPVHGAAEPWAGGAAERASLSRRVGGLRRSRPAARDGHHRPGGLVHGRPLLRDDGRHVPRGLRLGADGDRRGRGGARRLAGGVLAVPAAGAPRLYRPLLGLLLSQQRGHRR